MAMKTYELAILIKQTEWFIDSDPSQITLVPKVEARTAGTVTFSDGVPRQTQTFKVIWSSDSNIQRPVGAEGGSRRLDFVLVGVPSALISIGDSFQHGGNRYVVEWVAPPNGYQVKAGGVSHGAYPSL